MYEYLLCSLLDLLRAAILNFYDVMWLPLLLRVGILLYAPIGKPFYVIDIQNVCARKI